MTAPQQTPLTLDEIHDRAGELTAHIGPLMYERSRLLRAADHADHCDCHGLEDVDPYERLDRIVETGLTAVQGTTALLEWFADQARELRDGKAAR